MASGVRGAYVRLSLHSDTDGPPALTWAGSLLKSPTPLKERLCPGGEGFYRRARLARSDYHLTIFQRFFGSSNDRKVKALAARALKITALEPATHALTDEQLRAKTVEFRERLSRVSPLDRRSRHATVMQRRCSSVGA
eukprot:gene64001-87523_t